MQPPPIDFGALKTPQRSGLPPCLYVPIGARSIRAIRKYVGIVSRILCRPRSHDALLIEPYIGRPMECELPIWREEGARVITQSKQVWVHVDYSAYRKAYLCAYPETDRSLVLDHVLNRREARLKGFDYLRLVPVSRAVNSSHGGLSERWGGEYHSSDRMVKANNQSGAEVQYADLADLIKMMNIQGGGSLMEEVINMGQALVGPPVHAGDNTCHCNKWVPHYSKIP